MEESESASTMGLIIVFKLYQEGRIDDEQRELLKGKYRNLYISKLPSLSFFLMWEILRNFEGQEKTRERLMRKGEFYMLVNSER